MMPDRSKQTEKHLATLSDWIDRACAAASRYRYNETKQAVQAVPMSDRESAAASRLYELHSDLIASLSREEHYKRTRGAGDRPGVSVDDVMQEAYILMLRALVRYRGGGFRAHLRYALRDRIRTYLDSKTRLPDPGPENRPPVEATSTAGRSTEHPHVDVASIVGRMVADGTLSEDSEQQADLEALWGRLT